MTMQENIVEKAKNQAKYHSIYLWSAQGQHVKSLKISKIKSMETSGANAARVLRRIADIIAQGYYSRNTRAFDCSGLICWLLVLVGAEAAGFDMTANGLYNRYTHVLSTNDLIAGDLVYKLENGKAVHVGLYIGGGMLVEAKGRDAGVVISTLTDSWIAGNRPNYK